MSVLSITSLVQQLDDRDVNLISRRFVDDIVSKIDNEIDNLSRDSTINVKEDVIGNIMRFKNIIIRISAEITFEGLGIDHFMIAVSYFDLIRNNDWLWKTTEEEFEKMDFPVKPDGRELNLRDVRNIENTIFNLSEGDLTFALEDDDKIILKKLLKERKKLGRIQTVNINNVIFEPNQSREELLEEFVNTLSDNVINQVNGKLGGWFISNTRSGTRSFESTKSDLVSWLSSVEFAFNDGEAKSDKHDDKNVLIESRPGKQGWDHNFGYTGEIDFRNIHRIFIFVIKRLNSFRKSKGEREFKFITIKDEKEEEINPIFGLEEFKDISDFDSSDLENTPIDRIFVSGRASLDFAFYIYLMRKYEGGLCMLINPENFHTANKFELTMDGQGNVTKTPFGKHMQRFIRKMRVCAKRDKIVIVPLTIRWKDKDGGSHAHANILLYRKDLEKGINRVEHFEPHGSLLRASDVNPILIYKNLKDMFNIQGIDYLPPTTTCPDEGFQSRVFNNTEEGEIGFCLAWSWFMIDMRLRFIDEDAKNVFNLVIAILEREVGTFEKFIRAFEKSMRKIIKGRNKFEFFDFFTKEIMRLNERTLVRVIAKPKKVKKRGLAKEVFKISESIPDVDIDFIKRNLKVGKEKFRENFIKAIIKIRKKSSMVARLRIEGSIEEKVLNKSKTIVKNYYIILEKIDKNTIIEVSQDEYVINGQTFPFK